MRKTGFVLCLVTFFTASASGVGFLGTPTAEIGEGNWSTGYDFTFSSQDFKTATWLVQGQETMTGEPDDGGTFALRARVKDLDIRRHYATVGYGLNPQWDVYLRLGINSTRAKLQGEREGEVLSANFGNDFAWGWGTRYTFAEDGNIAWGAGLQMNWIDAEWDAGYTVEDDGWVGVERRASEYKSYDLLLCAGPTVDMGGWSLYGGPFFYYVDGEFTYSEQIYAEEEGTGDIYTFTARGTIDTRTRSNFGGFVGSVFELAPAASATLELASTFRGDWALSAGLAYAF